MDEKAGKARKALHSKLWDAGIRVSRTEVKKLAGGGFRATLIYYLGTKRLMVREDGPTPIEAIDAAHTALSGEYAED